jgi:hypothetical protein
MKKPSEVFEGKNSSLRRTFNEAVREEFKKKFTAFTDYFTPEQQDYMIDFFLSRTITKADLLEWIEENERNAVGKLLDQPTLEERDNYFYNQALQDLKKFISGE